MDEHRVRKRMYVAMQAYVATALRVGRRHTCMHTVVLVKMLFCKGSDAKVAAQLPLLPRGGVAQMYTRCTKKLLKNYMGRRGLCNVPATQVA